MDQWEALFTIWHHRDHETQDIDDSLHQLENRIVRLEAYVAARRKANAARA